MSNSHLTNFQVAEKDFMAVSFNATNVRFTGAAINTRKVNMRFEHCVFERNSDNKNSSISFLLARVDFIGCVFIGSNDVENHSLAVPDAPVAAGRFSTGSFVDCTFTNTRGFPAGGLFAGPFAIITLSNTTFSYGLSLSKRQRRLPLLYVLHFATL